MGDAERPLAVLRYANVGVDLCSERALDVVLRHLSGASASPSASLAHDTVSGAVKQGEPSMGHFFIGDLDSEACDETESTIDAFDASDHDAGALERSMTVSGDGVGGHHPAQDMHFGMDPV